MTTEQEQFETRKSRRYESMARSIVWQLESFCPLVIGNAVYVPKRGSIEEVIEVTGLDQELIFDHPEYNYWVIDCPEPE